MPRKMQKAKMISLLIEKSDYILLKQKVKNVSAFFRECVKKELSKNMPQQDTSMP